MHFSRSQPKSEASKQWERASIKILPGPPTPPPPLPPQSGESEWEREAGRLAEESHAKSLNVPQQQHQELRRGQPSVCASVPVHRAKVALLGGVDVSFLIFAASVHYPGRLKTRALIPSNPLPHAHTHTQTNKQTHMIHNSRAFFVKSWSMNMHICIFPL